MPDPLARAKVIAHAADVAMNDPEHPGNEMAIARGLMLAQVYVDIAMVEELRAQRAKKGKKK